MLKNKLLSVILILIFTLSGLSTIYAKAKEPSDPTILTQEQVDKIIGVQKNDTRIVSEKELELIQKETEAYQNKMNKKELTKEETYNILEKLGIKGVRVYSEEELKNQSTTSSQDTSSALGLTPNIDLVLQTFTNLIANDTTFQVQFSLFNLDLFETHTQYAGYVYGYCAVAPGATTYMQNVRNYVNEQYIRPLSGRTFTYYQSNRGGKAYYQTQLLMVANGNIGHLRQMTYWNVY
jgi:hypothetical protein